MTPERPPRVYVVIELAPREESPEDDAATAAVTDLIQAELGPWYEAQVSSGRAITPQAIPPDAVRDHDQEDRLNGALAEHLADAAGHVLLAARSSVRAAREAQIAACLELMRAMRAIRAVVVWVAPKVGEAGEQVTVGVLVKLVVDAIKARL